MKKKNIRLKHADKRFEWNSNHIKSHNDFVSGHELGKLYCKSGDSLLYLTRQIDGLKGFGIITKVMKYKNYRDFLQIIQDHKIVKSFNLFGYGPLYYGPNKNEIYLPMKRCLYSLRQCVKRKIEVQTRHKFIYNSNGKFKMNKAALKSIKYFILETAGKLYTLHNNHYIHLDIKPANITFQFNENMDSYQHNGWTLIDYGISKYVKPSVGHIKQNGYCGTIGYTAPEINVFANKNRPNIVDTACDIWSLALCVLYILNNGRNLFSVTEKDVSDENLKTKKQKYEYFYIQKLKAENKNNCGTKMMTKYLRELLFKRVINIELYGLLSKMLSYNPAKRPTAEEIIKHKMFKQYIKQSDCKTGYFIKYYATRLPTKITMDKLPNKWHQLTNPILYE